LEYAKDKDFDYIITVDDDRVFSRHAYLSYLLSFAGLSPGTAVTVGGIRLAHRPYHRRWGLRYRSWFRFVDAPSGYQGVVYPVRPLLAHPAPFVLRDHLPDGVFHDDDAYFGILLRTLGIPLLSIPPCPLNWSRNTLGAGASGVAEKAGKSRENNESDVFRAVVAKGLLGPKTARGKTSVALKARMLAIYLRYFFAGAGKAR